jgi:hypothetical protein
MRRLIEENAEGCLRAAVLPSLNFSHERRETL